jgi:hypothetical protein
MPVGVTVRHLEEKYRSLVLTYQKQNANLTHLNVSFMKPSK